MLNLAHNPADELGARKVWRYAALEWLRDVTARKSGERCMFAVGASVTVGATALGVTMVSGVGRCGSPWACPVCAPTIGERRAKEIDWAIRSWCEQGGCVLFVTATLSHQYGDELGQLLGMLQDSWSRTFRWGTGQRPAWYGGQVRAVEITHGVNGFHPHVHAAIFVEPGHGVDQVLVEVEAMRYRWERAVRRNGGDTDVRSAGSYGWDVRKVTHNGLGPYLAKIQGGWGVGLELARLDLKQGRIGKTPTEVLAAAMLGDRRARRLYRIFETATAGRRRIVSSPGLMDRCKVVVLTDDEAAPGDVKDEAVAVASVPAREWRRILAAGHAVRLMADVAAVVRGDGWAWPADWLVVQPAIQR